MKIWQKELKIYKKVFHNKAVQLENEINLLFHFQVELLYILASYLKLRR